MIWNKTKLSQTPLIISVGCRNTSTPRLLCVYLLVNLLMQCARWHILHEGSYIGVKDSVDFDIILATLHLKVSKYTLRIKHNLNLR